MKEILYYNSESLNSVLSQFGKGIIKSLQIEQNENSSDTLSTTNDGKIDSGLALNLKLSSGSLPGGEINLGGNFGGQAGVGFGTTQTFSEGQRDVIEKIFHDHALDLLLERLNENHPLETNSEKLEEGEFTFVQGRYRFYDFELLKNISNPEILSSLLKMADDAVPESEKDKIRKFGKKVEEGNQKGLTQNEKTNFDEYTKKYQSILKEEAASIGFGMVNSLSQFSNEVISGLVLFKIGDYIIIGHKDNMRVSSEALSFRADSSHRELKVLGRVIGKKDSNLELADIFTDFKIEDFDKIPSLMLDIVIKSLGISKTGESIIEPIAIYYEET